MDFAHVPMPHGWPRPVIKPADSQHRPHASVQHERPQLIWTRPRADTTAHICVCFMGNCCFLSPAGCDEMSLIASRQRKQAGWWTGSVRAQVKIIDLPGFCVRVRGGRWRPVANWTLLCLYVNPSGPALHPTRCVAAASRTEAGTETAGGDRLFLCFFGIYNLQRFHKLRPSFHFILLFSSFRFPPSFEPC